MKSIKAKPAQVLLYLLITIPSITMGTQKTYATVPTVERPASAVPSNPTATDPSETEYTLGAGDRIKVDVFQVQEYSGEYVVLVDGTVGLPLIGRLRVDGMSIPQIGSEISRLYAKYLRRPLVTVSLVTPRPVKTAISGEVSKPGAYTLKTDQSFPTVTELIQTAGGLTTIADIRKVQIRRIIKGQEKMVEVDLWTLLQQGTINQDITLRDGDIVFIPTKQNIDLAETRQLADASFGIKTENPIAVVVVGEVYRPGSYQFRPEPGVQKIDKPRLTQAVRLAGGIKPLANIRKVQLRRQTRSGPEQTIDVDLWALIQTGNVDEDVILQEGDTIIIPKADDIDPKESESLASASFSPGIVKVNVVGEVKSPGSIDVPANTPLNQAILAAGGFNEQRAEQNTVELVRLNPNGTVSKRQITINFANGINEETNPTLRQNDVVVVSRSGLTQVTDTLGTVLSPIVGGFFSLFNFFNIFN